MIALVVKVLVGVLVVLAVLWFLGVQYGYVVLLHF